MKRLMLMTAVALMAGVAVLAFAANGTKLPKCSKTLCRSVNCSPDVLCASGTTVKTCAEICH